MRTSVGVCSYTKLSLEWINGYFITQIHIEVIDHYSDGVQQHPNLHFRLSIVDDGPPGGIPNKLSLTKEEKAALIAFLKTLTDQSITTDEKYSDPFL